MMCRPLVLLCIIAAPALVAGFGEWKTDFKVKFSIGMDGFPSLPYTKDDAIKQGWELKNMPDGNPILKYFELYCKPDLFDACQLFDDTGYLAGTQWSLPKDEFTGYYDMADQGFTVWSTTQNGNPREFYVSTIFHVSLETAALSKETRLAKRKDSALFPDGAIWVPGYRGELIKVPLDKDEFTKTNIDFTPQACVPFMGKHYYYKMTKDTQCTAESLLTTFLLKDMKEQHVGYGRMVFGNFSTQHSPNWYENPTRPAVEMIVPNGSECFYGLAETPGVSTMHVYHVNSPRLINCLGFLG